MRYDLGEMIPKIPWATIDRKPIVTDGAIALALGALAELQLWALWGSAQPDMHPALAAGLVAIIILPLTLRRRFPLPVLLIMTALVLTRSVLQVPEAMTGNAVLLAVLSGAAYGGRWRNWACGLSVGSMMGYVTIQAGVADLAGFEGNRIVLIVMSLAWNYVIFGTTWWFGNVLSARRERTRELETTAEQLQHERDENARRAVLDERVRIARELHDVVAHHVSVMGVQAGAARRVMESQPDKAQEALSSVESSSRHAIVELQKLVGFLRREGEVDDLAPQPSLQDLDALIADIDQAGLPVEVKVEGDEKPLPPSVDLSAYRIVQEALTNTLKHAGPARATVTVRYAEDAIELEILDDGRGPDSSEGRQNGGKGLIGMQERVSLHGGEFNAGNIQGVGFTVRAVLPLAGPRS